MVLVKVIIYRSSLIDNINILRTIYSKLFNQPHLRIQCVEKSKVWLFLWYTYHEVDDGFIKIKFEDVIIECLKRDWA